MLKLFYYFLTLALLVFSSWASNDAFADNLSSQGQNAERIGQLIKQTNLLKLPEHQSDVIGSAKADKDISIKTRQRAWYYISSGLVPESEQLSGWVSMLSVRFTGSAKREGDLGINSLFSSATKGSLPTVSTGVRGFDEADLKNAKANISQLALLDGYSVSSGIAARFAKQGKLKSNEIIIKEGAEK